MTPSELKQFIRVTAQNLGFSKIGITPAKPDPISEKKLTTWLGKDYHSTMRWMEIKSDEIQQGINRLWNLNRFNDIKIILDHENHEGIDIIIQLDEADVLNNFSVSGNKKISNNKIKEIIELEEGQILTNKNIFDSKLKVIDAYKEKGYHNIQITDSTEASEFDYASNLSFKIIEGNKTKIKGMGGCC